MPPAAPAVKAARLKQAKDEADREISFYKADRETEFKRKVADDSSSSQENVVRLGEESAKAVKAIQESIQQKKNDVLSLLLSHVTAVKFQK